MGLSYRTRRYIRLLQLIKLSQPIPPFFERRVRLHQNTKTITASSIPRIAAAREPLPPIPPPPNTNFHPRCFPQEYPTRRFVEARQFLRAPPTCRNGWTPFRPSFYGFSLESPFLLASFAKSCGALVLHDLLYDLVDSEFHVG